jgi:hypothetical protein
VAIVIDPNQVRADRADENLAGFVFPERMAADPVRVCPYRERCDATAKITTGNTTWKATKVNQDFGP